MFWIALAKAINNVQRGVAEQDAKRKQAAYSTEADLPIENPAVRFGMSPDEEQKTNLLLAPKELPDEDEDYFD